MRDLLAAHRCGATPPAARARAGSPSRFADPRRLAGLLALAVAVTLSFLLLGASAAGAAPAAAQTAVASVPLAATVGAGNTVFEFSKDAVVPKGEHVENAVSVGGSVIVRGTADVAVAVGGDIQVLGTVRKTCVAVGGDVRLGPNASVGGAQTSQKDAAVVLVGGNLVRQAGAQVHGKVTEVHGAWIANALGAVNPFRPGSIFGWIVWTAVAVVLAVIAVAVAPRQMTTIAETMRKRPLGSLGWGALTALVMIPISLVILAITVVGLLLVIPWVLFTPFLIAFSYLCLGLAVGLLVFRGSQSRANLYLTATVGVLIVSVVRLIPVAGFIASALGTLLAFGAIVLSVADRQRRRRDQRRAAAAAPYGWPGGPVPPTGPCPPGGPVSPSGPYPPGGPAATGPGSPMAGGGPFGNAAPGQTQPAWAPPGGQAPGQSQQQWASGPAPGQPGPWIAAQDAAARDAAPPASAQPAQWAPPPPQTAPWEPLPVPPQVPQPQAVGQTAATVGQTPASPPRPVEATQVAEAADVEATQIAETDASDVPEEPAAAPEAPPAPPAEPPVDTTSRPAT